MTKQPRAWFNSEQGILGHYREEREAEEKRHAEAMARIRNTETQQLEAFRAMIVANPELKDLLA